MAKILIAEDEKDIRELIVFSLSFAGFEVVSAVDGIEAVERQPFSEPTAARGSLIDPGHELMSLFLRS